MGRTERCQHTYGGLDDVVQGLHLTRLADARLKQGHIGMLAKQPY